MSRVKSDETFSGIKPQLHVSMLNMLAKCGIQFQRRYGERFGIWEKEEVIPPGIALLLGRNVHTVAEQDFLNKISTGELLSSEEIKDISRTAFESEWNEGVTLQEEEAIDQKKTYGEAVDRAVDLSLKYHSTLAPTVFPVEVEKKFVIELKGYPVDLAGRIDILEDDAVGDIKTMSKNEPSVMSPQMAMYATAFKMETGRFPSKVYHHKVIKTKTPKTDIEVLAPGPSWINPLYRRIERFIEILDAVRAGKQALMPADPQGWICTKRYCGYAITCKFWSGR
ncbi:MAG: PD-(D/E)XK nuclease family protein [Candidatus Zixiibacteriota bacterium]